MMLYHRIKSKAIELLIPETEIKRISYDPKAQLIVIVCSDIEYQVLLTDNKERNNEIWKTIVNHIEHEMPVCYESDKLRIVGGE